MNTTKSLTQLADDFLMQHDINNLTRLQYQSNLHQLIKYLRESERSERHITKRDIIDFKRAMQDQGRSAATVASYLTTFRMFFQYLRDVNLLHENIMLGIKYPKKDKSYKKLPLTDDQVYQLMKSVATDSLSGLRDYSIINLMLLTGLRTVEVARIRIKDIIEKYGKRMLLIKGKGRFDYSDAIDLTDEAWEPINDYLVNRDITDDSYMFVSGSNRNKGNPLTARRVGVIVTGYLRRANIKSKYYTAHSLRHTAAMKYLEIHNEDYEKLRIFMRHESASTTQVYTHMFREKIKQSRNQYNIENAYPHLKKSQNERAT